MPSFFQKKNLLKGGLLIIMGIFIYTSTNALLKACHQAYPPLEIVFFRNAFALIPLFFLMKTKENMVKAFRLHHIWRGGLGVLSLCCLFASIHYLPFAEATVIMFTSGFFTVLFGRILLKEALTPLKALSIFIGFIGVIIMARPGNGSSAYAATAFLGVVVALISACSEGFLVVHGRKLLSKESPQLIVLFYSLVSTAITAITLPFVWQTPVGIDWLYLIVLGLGGGIGQFCITRAYLYAEASTLAPLFFSAMIWSFCYGHFFFDEVFTVNGLVGSTLIIFASVLVLAGDKSKKQGLEERSGEEGSKSPPIPKRCAK
jgi:drug/metabolite transporter (DMT)-like permease